MLRDITSPLRCWTDEKSTDVYSNFRFYRVKKISNINLWKCLKESRGRRGTLFNTTRVVFLEHHFRVITEAVGIRFWSAIQAFSDLFWPFFAFCVLFLTITSHLGYVVAAWADERKWIFMILNWTELTARRYILEILLLQGGRSLNVYEIACRLQNSETRNTTGSHAEFVQCKDIFKFMSKLISCHGRNCLLRNQYCLRQLRNFRQFSAFCEGWMFISLLTITSVLIVSLVRWF